MAKAHQNQRTFPIDIRHIAEALGSNETSTNEVREKALKEIFPVEKDGELHLPGVLSEEFQVEGLHEKPGIPLPRHK
ncbi:hypothetical protein PAXRUDRAFT_21936 [Paxillus rubicundulus Ve08.2h10]|uniref:Uncharacterized protein n=1 Tax=Paxillus rubicundulus Ve08.2h10 TaxID=930991 RepID=A0A0D0CYI3_9AGAM|nr:hypothetical protein PAXRUDRAFT_21936 [Paxillus rubicundulus Ve08.2h10]